LIKTRKNNKTMAFGRTSKAQQLRGTKEHYD
jgi:hypothetical protein